MQILGCLCEERVMPKGPDLAHHCSRVAPCPTYYNLVVSCRAHANPTQLTRLIWTILSYHIIKAKLGLRLISRDKFWTFDLKTKYGSKLASSFVRFGHGTNKG